MALKELLSGLEGGLDAYPNHNTPSTSGGFNYEGSTSVFDNKIFRQKSFKFGQGTTFDRPNGGFSSEPFITSPTIDILSGNPGLETTINLFTDGLIRGGAITHAERLITDGERIGRFLISPKGLAFITKQVGLQLTNPKISEPGVNISRANQRTYNVGINTLASVVSAGTGLYIKREGRTPIARTGYVQASKLFKDDNNNRLWNLFEDHIEKQTTFKEEKGKLGKFFSNVGEGLRKAKNFLLGDSGGKPLYAYNGGPGSLFGIGRTQIRKYAPYITDTEGKGISRDEIETGYLGGVKFNKKYGDSSNYGVSNVFTTGENPLDQSSFSLFDKDPKPAGETLFNELNITDQYNPETKLNNPAAASIIFGDEKSFSKYQPHSLFDLRYSPFKYQSKEDKKDNYHEALVGYNHVLSLRHMGNVALFEKLKTPQGNQPTETFFNSGGKIALRSAEFGEDLNYKNREPDSGYSFSPQTYFEKDNYKVSPNDLQDFRKLKKDALGTNYPQPFTDYQQKTNHRRSYYREQRVNMGNPGKRLAGTTGKNIFGTTTDSYDMYDESTIDKINALDIFRQKNNDYEKADARDLIRFRVEALDGDDPSQADTMIFRAFLDDFGDNYSGTWNSFKYNGRAENFYTYGGFDRKLSFSFKIAAQSRHEMVPIYRKLNFLVSQTAPDYSGTRMRGNFCRLTIGSLIDRTPGFFTAVSLKWQKDYPWDIALNHLERNVTRKTEDADGAMVMPHVLDVNCSFTPIHNFIPKKSISDSPFIMSHENNRYLQPNQKWYKKGAAENVNKAFMHHIEGLKTATQSDLELLDDGTSLERMEVRDGLLQSGIPSEIPALRAFPSNPTDVLDRMEVRDGLLQSGIPSEIPALRGPQLATPQSGRGSGGSGMGRKYFDDLENELLGG